MLFIAKSSVNLIDHSYIYFFCLSRVFLRINCRTSALDSWILLPIGSFAFKPAAFGAAGQKSPRLLGGFLHQKVGTAPGTWPWDGFVPKGIVAIRITVAPIKDLTAPGGFFNQDTLAIGSGAIHSGLFGGSAGIYRHGMGAVRVAAAGEEFSIFSLPDHQRFAAFCADLIGNFRLCDLNRLNPALLIPDIVP